MVMELPVRKITYRVMTKYPRKLGYFYNDIFSFKIIRLIADTLSEDIFKKKIRNGKQIRLMSSGDKIGFREK